jgi:hypothetical protein
MVIVDTLLLGRYFAIIIYFLTLIPTASKPKQKPRLVAEKSQHYPTPCTVMLGGGEDMLIKNVSCAELSSKAH